MITRFIYSILFLICTIVSANAQSKDILARSAMLNAEEAYGNGNYQECLSFLSNAETTLGKTNSRIQYLRVKTLMTLGEQTGKQTFILAETELKRYFEVTREDEAAPEKYDEMVKAVSVIKKRINEYEIIEREKQRVREQEKQIEETTFIDAKGKNSIREYLNYTKRYPNGKYAGEAKERINKLFIPLWMQRNLDVDHYSNGDKIPNPNKFADNGITRKGSYCIYRNSSSFNKEYGKLYNYYAVTDPRGLCPSGWHVSSSGEWEMLISYLGGYHVAGLKLKEKEGSHWKKGNYGATDEIGFTALPGGEIMRNFNWFYYGVGEEGCWWCSDGYKVQISSNPTYILIVKVPDSVSKTDMADGYSVRCIKDY